MARPPAAQMKSDNGGGDIRRARRAVAQGLQNLSDAGAVIVGGAAWRLYRPPATRPVVASCGKRSEDVADAGGLAASGSAAAP